MTEAIAVPIVTIDGSEVDALLYLQQVRIARETGAPTRADIQLDLALDPPFVSQLKPGAALTVASSNDSSGSNDLFDGEIVTVGFERRVDRDVISVEAYDLSHRLGRAVVNEVFLEQRGSDVISALLQTAGLSLSASGCFTTPIPYFHAASTPRRIIDELCARDGLEWYTSGTTLHIEHRTDRDLGTIDSDTLRSIDLRASSLDQAVDATVRGWDPDVGRVAESTTTLPSAGYSKNESTMVSNVRTDLDDRSPAITTPTPRVADQLVSKEAEGWARILDSTVVRGRGEVLVNPGLTPGGQVTITDLHDDWSGKYHVTGVEHLFGTNRTFITRFRIGPIRRDSDASDRGVGRLGASPIIGIVTNTGFGKNDEKKSPMVQVKYPTLDANVQTDWIRVLTTGAGNDRGFVMPYQVDDEVLVGFVHGDMSSPVVLGGLHSDHQPPPEELEVVNGRHDAIVLKSQNNTIRIVDNGELPGLHLEIDSVNVDIDNEKVIVNSAALPITMKNDSGSIEIDDQGAITIDGASLTVTTQQAIELEATGDAKVTGMNVKLEAQTGLEAKGNASAKLESSGMTDVKGALVNLN